MSLDTPHINNDDDEKLISLAPLACNLQHCIDEPAAIYRQVHFFFLFISLRRCDFYLFSFFCCCCIFLHFCAGLCVCILISFSHVFHVSSDGKFPCALFNWVCVRAAVYTTSASAALRYIRCTAIIMIMSLFMMRFLLNCSIFRTLK